MRIDQITDLEQMRQLAQLLEAKNTRLHKRLEALVTQLAALQGQVRLLPRGHRPKAQPQLPIIEQRHELPECDRAWIICKGKLVRLGTRPRTRKRLAWCSGSLC